MRLLSVELRRGLRRQSNRFIAIVAAGIFVVVGAVSLVKVGDINGRRILKESDGKVLIKNDGRKVYLQIKDDTLIVTEVPSGASGGSEVPGSFIQELMGQQVVLEGAENKQTFSVGGGISLARFSDTFGNYGGQSSADGAITFLAFLCLLIGASMVGADWKWNTYGVLLTWIPQRLRFLGVRLAACFLFGAAFMISLLIFFCIATIPTVIVHGNFDGLTASWWSGAGESIFRAAMAGGLVALGAGSVAMIFRNTAAALVAAMGYVIILQPIILVLRPKWWPFAVSHLAGSAISWKSRLIGTSTVSPTQAITTLAVILLAVVALAAFTFKRRDIAAS